MRQEVIFAAGGRSLLSKTKYEDATWVDFIYKSEKDESASRNERSTVNNIYTT